MCSQWFDRDRLLLTTKPQKTAGDKLDEVSKHFDNILKQLLAREAESDLPGACKSCHNTAASFRCRECTQGRVLCRRCMIQVHQHLPWHWVQEWTGSYFVRRDLCDIGYVLHLGHGGRPCPQSPTIRSPIPFVVTHTNGIHDVKLELCHCPGRMSLAEQLLQVDLYPATWEKPASAFTFDVLDDSHEDALASKKAAYDYIKKLKRRTNNSDEDSVTVSRIPDPTLEADTSLC